VPSTTPQEFRRAASFLAAGITVVTTRLAEVDHAMTASSFTTVSLEPPLVLVCAERETRFLDAVLTSGQWAASVLDATSQDAAVWFATKGRPLDGQLDTVAHTRGPLTGSAVLSSALSVFECSTTATYDGGDHVIVVGQVLGVDVPARQEADRTGPLVHFRGRYITVGPSH
jgi:flavin reductase (DIM6/NTAB) family NADH-FMN oxidoreductase RutF